MAIFKGDIERTDTIADHKVGFSVIEAYKTIRTNLMFAVNKKGCKKILVCGAQPMDGKSTTCVNLGISLSQMETKVLIVDCDLRKARVHRFFNITNSVGISDVLGGMCELSKAIRGTQSPYLKILPAGTVPPNPAELLASDAMKEAVEELGKEFDYILFDTPPINLVSDALTLTKITDGVIMVAKKGKTTHPEFKKALENLEFVEAKVVGIILNGVEAGGGYGSKKKYGYDYYGYGHSE